MYSTDRIKIISIEGIIGAGKSTLLKKVKEEFDRRFKHLGESIHIVPESLDIWKNITDEEGKDILSLFYSDPQKFSFMFQCVTSTTLKKSIVNSRKKFPTSILLVERSLETVSHVFENMLYENKCISGVEHKIFNLIYNEYRNSIHTEARIFLNTDIKTAMDRIKLRNRYGEQDIDEQYLNLLFQKHQSLFTNFPIPTCEINGNVSKNDKLYRDNVSKIVEFLGQYI